MPTRVLVDEIDRIDPSPQFVQEVWVNCTACNFLLDIIFIYAPEDAIRELGIDNVPPF